MTAEALPVVVIGAGPVGLAAAARLLERGLSPLVLEQGSSVGSAVSAWGHVRLFSPWRFNIDAAARDLLAETGWQAPAPEQLPTGHDLVRDYLAPLAGHPALVSRVVFRARVAAVTRRGLDKLGSSDRAAAPFVVLWHDAEGREHQTEARAVLDASGTWGSPNPMGVDGLPVTGEKQAAHVAYGIPDLLDRERDGYAGRRVLVVVGGHSAINVAHDLLRLQETAPKTEVVWALRRDRIDRLLGGGLDDQLPERGALGVAATRAIAAGRIEGPGTVRCRADRHARRPLADRGAHGRQARDAVGRSHRRRDRFRPELGILRELRIALDPTVEAPPALAPLIDPNLHSCGTVPPHGALELRHPEPGLYIVGSKSYGRAPTFLMATGYEQVRSVVAEIAGDQAAARAVNLVLPETGVCSAGPLEEAVSAGCCGGPAPAGVDACCQRDADVKDAGKQGCGCGSDEVVAGAGAA